METGEVSKNKIIREFTSDVHNEGDPKDPKVIYIREGVAPKLLDEIKPNKVHLSGVISAPAIFYERRKKLHNPDKCHVLYDMTAGTITLVVDENFENDNYKITGKIIDNPDLKQFKINGGGSSIFTISDLKDLLKFTRMHFADKDENATAVLALQNFKAEVKKTFEDSDDDRGNTHEAKIVKLETSLQQSFVLNMPIYKGGSNHKFKVDICLSARDRGVDVWLESRELKELQDSTKDEIIKTELVAFAEIVRIEQ